MILLVSFFIADEHFVFVFGKVIDLRCIFSEFRVGPPLIIGPCACLNG